MISKKKVYTEILSNFPAEIRNSNVFSRRKQVISKKKESSSPKCHEIRCETTKITKKQVANTNLALDLHSSSPEPVNFFRAQSSLGVAQFSFGGNKQSFGEQAVIWAKMTSFLVFRLIPNLLKMCVIKFDSKPGCIKAKRFRSYIKITKRGGQICPSPVQIGLKL